MPGLAGCDGSIGAPKKIQIRLANKGERLFQVAVSQVVQMLADRFRGAHSIDPQGLGHPGLPLPGAQGFVVALPRAERGDVGNQDVTPWDPAGPLEVGLGEGRPEVRETPDRVAHQGDSAHAREGQALGSTNQNPAFCRHLNLIAHRRLSSRIIIH